MPGTWLPSLGSLRIQNITYYGFQVATSGIYNVYKLIDYNLAAPGLVPYATSWSSKPAFNLDAIMSYGGTTYPYFTLPTWLDVFARLNQAEWAYFEFDFGRPVALKSIQCYAAGANCLGSKALLIGSDYTATITPPGGLPSISRPCVREAETFDLTRSYTAQPRVDSVLAVLDTPGSNADLIVGPDLTGRMYRYYRMMFTNLVGETGFDGSEIYEFVPTVVPGKRYAYADWHSIFSRGKRHNLHVSAGDNGNELVITDNDIDGTTGMTTFTSWSTQSCLDGEAGTGGPYYGSYLACTNKAFWFTFAEKVICAGIDLSTTAGSATFTNGMWQPWGSNDAGVTRTPIGPALLWDCTPTGGSHGQNGAQMLFPDNGDEFTTYGFSCASTGNVLYNGRWCDEVFFKIAHSPLDGGDRRTGTHLVIISHSAGLGGSGINTIPIDGVYIQSDSWSAPNAGVDITGWLPGEHLDFNFGKPVTLANAVLNQSVSARDYTDFIWRYSDDGATWTLSTTPPFSPSMYDPLNATATTFEECVMPGDPDAGPHQYWRLESNTFSGTMYQVGEFVFRLDSDDKVTVYSAHFTDDSDLLQVPVTLTKTNPPPPFSAVAFADDVPELEAVVTIQQNQLLTIAFSDGDSDKLTIFSDLFGSLIVQQQVFVTKR